MALFGKKKFTLEELLKGVQDLSTDEKAQFLDALKGMNESKEEVKEENKEEVVEEEKVEGTEETEEVVEDVEKVDDNQEAETVEEEINPEQGEEVIEETDVDKTEETASFPEEESARDEMAEDNRDEIIHQLTEKVNALEEGMKEMHELKSLMEEYTKKQADQFGYKGNLLGAKKDYSEMSTEELKARQMKGI